MPPKKRKGANSRSAPPRSNRATRQSTRKRTGNTSNGIPDVYQEMLEEAVTDAPDESQVVARPAKRRRVSVEHTQHVDDLFESSPTPPPAPSPKLEQQEDEPLPVRSQQVIYDDFEGSDDFEDESDIEFEDVEILSVEQTVAADEPAPPPKLIQIDLNKSVLETPKRAIQKRKQISKEERMMRLDVHKWHLLSLIAHGLHRNSWCNSEEIHKILKPLVSRKVINLVHVEDSKPLYERNYSFNKGIEEICALWRSTWKNTIQGLRRPYWREDVDARMEVENGEDLDFEDFRDAARTCRGSRDLGAQLFTALLRSIAIETRLVFSLQVLPFSGAAKAETPLKLQPKSKYVHAPSQNYGAASSSSSPFTPPLPKTKKPKKIIDSQFPIFWTEVLTPNRTWVPLDPIVRNSVAKPKTQFEPSLSDNLNSMAYVLAYEDDNSARDVTRRYAQWYNAKTRKLRVESTKNGEQWYTAALEVLTKRLKEPRDHLEDDELARRSNSEGMPHNIQDFKNHPIYVLERHMRANEVLQPRREVGKMNVGTAKNGKIESVYRRQDVNLCRTADAWYRRGRDVKAGEQPLKRVLPKSRRGAQGTNTNFEDEDEDEENSEGVGLYAEYQTNIYEPPPVMDDQIPKNAYGNLDIYVPSMIPPGAVHVAHALAAAAAKILGIDFADAVTGFEFKGRQGTAVIDGVVVPEKFTAAVATVIDALERLGSEEVQQARSKIVLALWKRMLQALRVRERIETEYGSTTTTKPSGVREVDLDSGDESNSAYEDDVMDDVQGGGFMLEDEATEEKVQEQVVNMQMLKSKMPTILPDKIVSMPIKITRSPHKLLWQTRGDGTDAAAHGEENDDLFDDQQDDAEMGGGFVVDDENETHEARGGGFLLEAGEDDQGRGFIAEDDNENAGGFLPADESASSSQSQRRSVQQPRSGPWPAKIKSSVQTRGPPDNLTASFSSAHIHSEAFDPDDQVHSDIEEDAALQLAIAESLADNGKASIDATQLPFPATDPKTGNLFPINTTTTTTDTVEESTHKDETHGKGKGKQNAASAANSDGANGWEADTPTSLLSHDPNEDDEEPEWLDDALD